MESHFEIIEEFVKTSSTGDKVKLIFGNFWKTPFIKIIVEQNQCDTNQFFIKGTEFVALFSGFMDFYSNDFDGLYYRDENFVFQFILFHEQQRINFVATNENFKLYLTQCGNEQKYMVASKEILHALIFLITNYNIIDKINSYDQIFV